jgi:aspartyl-tRNA(Asn)/glutamyl-tRNA(Gln) amidotransferase subunit B
LLEIVTNPDFRSSAEAKKFMQELQMILRYVGVSSADMEKGHLRCDANISLREFGAEKLGKKVEIKNMNSFSSLERALEYEIIRQGEMLDKGEEISQETRGWDDAKNITTSQRGKEMAHDYRYFPEPDLPPIVPAEAFDLEGLRKQIENTEFPFREKKKYEEMGLSNEGYIIKSVLNEPRYFPMFAPRLEKMRGFSPRIKLFDSLSSTTSGVISEQGKDWEDAYVENISEAARDISEGIYSINITKQLLPEMISSGNPISKIIEEKGIKEVSDTGELEKIIGEIIANNPAQTAEYRAGKIETLNWFVGQAMKATRGQANPGVVMEVLRKMLG